VLVCQSGAWKSFACRGLGGCSKYGVWCDVANGTEGDRCPNEDEKRRLCSDDHRSRLTCSGGKYVASRCVGIGCTIDEGKVTCELGEHSSARRAIRRRTARRAASTERATSGGGPPMDRRTHLPWSERF